MFLSLLICIDSILRWLGRTHLKSWHKWDTVSPRAQGPRWSCSLACIIASRCPSKAFFGNGVFCPFHFLYWTNWRGFGPRVVSAVVRAPLKIQHLWLPTPFRVRFIILPWALRVRSRLKFNIISSRGNRSSDEDMVVCEKMRVKLERRKSNADETQAANEEWRCRWGNALDGQ